MERQRPAERPRTAKAGFGALVLVCTKCAKRQSVPRRWLARSLKRALGPDSGGDTAARGKKTSRKVRIVETGCLGPCPKRMLAVATPDSLAHHRILLLDPALDEGALAGLRAATAGPLPAIARPPEPPADGDERG